MAELPGNVLFYGDNLDVLRRYVQDATVDLVGHSNELAAIVVHADSPDSGGALAARA